MGNTRDWASRLLGAALALACASGAWADPATADGPKIVVVMPYGGSADPAALENDPEMAAQYKILHEVMDGSGVAWTALPIINTRSDKTLESGEAQCITHISHISAQEMGLDFMALYQSWFSFLGRKGSAMALKSVNDAARFRIGVAVGGRAQAILKAHDVTAEAVAYDALNLTKLNIDRIDLWFTSEDVLERLSNETRPTILLRVLQVKSGIACTRGIDSKSRDLIAKAAERFRRKHAPAEARSETIPIAE